MQNVNHSLTPAKVRRARTSAGLTQKQVADDLRLLSGNIIKITNTKLSRYEKGDVNLDEGTLIQLEKYLNEKTATLNDESNINSGTRLEDDDQVETGEPEQKDVNKQDIHFNSQDKNADLTSILRFDPDMNDYKREALIERFFSLSGQLDDLLESEVKRGFFGGVSEDTQGDAMACVYTMAGLFNIIRALQGNSVLPIQDDEESILDKDDILSLVQEKWHHFTDQGPVVATQE